MTETNTGAFSYPQGQGSNASMSSAPVGMTPEEIAAAQARIAQSFYGPQGQQAIPYQQPQSVSGYTQPMPSQAVPQNNPYQQSQAQAFAGTTQTAQAERAASAAQAPQGKTAYVSSKKRAKQQQKQQAKLRKQQAKQHKQQNKQQKKVAKGQKPKRRAFPAFLSGLLGVVLGLALGSGVMWHYLDSHTVAGGDIQTDVVTIPADDGNSTAIQISSDDAVTVAEAVSAKCFPSIVLIGVTSSSTGYWGDTTQSLGAGSGVILSEDGYILTNSHVVNGATSISVETDNGVYDAQVIGDDPSSDLAVIKIEATGLTPIEIGSSANLKLGEWVATIGSPFGYEKSIATGVVSSLSHSTSLESTTGYAIYADMIQTDASINPGNSGGALVDKEGKLVGITTLISSYSGSSSNVGFAIPIDYAFRIAQQMMAGQPVTHAYMGVTLATVDANAAAYYNLPVNAGAYVNAVLPGTPAEAAGLQQGDIIVAFEDETITTADELIIEVRSHVEGDVVHITYNRNGQEGTLQLTLGSDAQADQEE